MRGLCRVRGNVRITKTANTDSAIFVDQDVCLTHGVSWNCLIQRCRQKGVPFRGFHGQCPGRACGLRLERPTLPVGKGQKDDGQRKGGRENEYQS